MLSAADVGAKHKRERWFLLANACGQRIRQDFGTVPGEQEEGYETWRNGTLDSGADVPYANVSRLAVGKGRIENPSKEQSPSVRADWRQSEPNLGGMADGLPPTLVESLPGYLSADYWQEEPKGIPRVTLEKDQRVECIKRLGNAVVPLQVKTAFEYLMGLSRCSQKDNDLFDYE